MFLGGEGCRAPAASRKRELYARGGGEEKGKKDLSKKKERGFIDLKADTHEGDAAAKSKGGEPHSHS